MTRDLEKHKETKKEWYINNKPLALERSTTHRQKKQLKLKKYKEIRGCTYCPEKYGPCLEYHHTDPTTKIDTISNLMRNKGWNAVIDEINKCILVCANCHRKVHDGIIKIE